MRFSNLNQKTKIVGLLIGAVVALSSCEGELEIVQSIDEEFSGIQRIEIESAFMEVNYEGRDGQTTVELDGLLESSRSGNFKIEYEQEGNTLNIELDKNGMSSGGNHRATINLVGPKNVALKVDSGSGNTLISGIENPTLSVNAGSGNIELRNSKVPSIQLQVSSGVISAYHIVGNLEAKASSGKIKVDQLEGNVSVAASSGQVEIRSLVGKLNVELSSGEIELMNVSEVEKLKVSSGNISGTSVGLGAKTKLVSSSGRIAIQTFSDLSAYNYDFEAGSGRVSVGESSSSGSLKINNGAPSTISGSVSSGWIEIKN